MENLSKEAGFSFNRRIGTRRLTTPTPIDGLSIILDKYRGLERRIN